MLRALTGKVDSTDSKLLLKMIQRGQAQRSQRNIAGGEQNQGLTLPNIITHYKAARIKTVWYWQKNTQEITGAG